MWLTLCSETQVSIGVVDQKVRLATCSVFQHATHLHVKNCIEVASRNLFQLY